MFKFSPDFFKSKTVRGAIIGVITVLLAAYAGEMSWPLAALGIWQAIQTVLARDTTAQSRNQVLATTDALHDAVTALHLKVDGLATKDVAHPGDKIADGEADAN